MNYLDPTNKLLIFIGWWVIFQRLYNNPGSAPACDVEACVGMAVVRGKIISCLQKFFISHYILSIAYKLALIGHLIDDQFIMTNELTEIFYQREDHSQLSAFVAAITTRVTKKVMLPRLKSH
ncbi:hypothetical protein MTR_5g070340 [Medicago truncatula]|uniref:Uncharacterized protein n=1 Tax=Medicago truncatula TaxID=3880 RepID=G7KE50_MEDTR|nr:hypothetical protein MTR_5g070340 [Medicago truncatula]